MKRMIQPDAGWSDRLMVRLRGVLLYARIGILAAAVVLPLKATATEGALREAFQATLAELRTTYGFPGVTAAYVLRDGTVGVAASGLADVEAGRPMSPQTRMLSASIGKTFVAATAVALARENGLSLETPVAQWLGDRPWFGRLPNHGDMTLRHLLTHTSGLPDHVHLKSFAADVSRRGNEAGNPFQPESLVAYVIDEKPLFNAGEGWHYTDTGYILVGLVIESIAGRGCFDEMIDRFVAPLGLTLTGPADRRELAGLATGYTSTNNSFGFPAKTVDVEGKLAWHPGIEWAGGGWVSNSRDLACWGAALFGGDAIQENDLDDLLRSVSVSRDNSDIRYGAGVAVCRASPFGPIYGHGGWIPGYISSLRYYARHGISIAFQINTDQLPEHDSEVAVKAMENRLIRVVLSAVEKGQ